MPALPCARCPSPLSWRNLTPYPPVLCLIFGKLSAFWGTFLPDKGGADVGAKSEGIACRGSSAGCLAEKKGDAKIEFLPDTDVVLAKYALEGLPSKVVTREYQLALPKEKLLAAELEKTRQQLEARR